MINWNFLGFGENESRPNYAIKGYFYQQTSYPDSKVHGGNMGPIWGRQDPGGPHVGPMNFAIWVKHDRVLSIDKRSHPHKNMYIYLLMHA